MSKPMFGKHFTAPEIAQKGGKWLAAARKWVQRKKANGERVTWGSNDVLQPPMTIGQVEEVASEAAAAAFIERAEMDDRIEKMRAARLHSEIKLTNERDELAAALLQASLDIMNLGAFLRLEGKTDLADIAMEMEKAARDALPKKTEEVE